MADCFGKVVKSLAGRDKGKLLAVVECFNNRYSVCDGKERPLDRPKSKNAKHLKFTNQVLDADSMSTNRKLYHALSGLSEEVK